MNGEPGSARVASALSRVPADEPGPGAAVAAFGAVAISVACVAAGIAWPQAASSLLRLLIALLALGYAVARAVHVLGRTRASPKEYTPFDGAVTERAPPAAPAGLRRMAGLLVAADHGDLADRTAVPQVTQNILRRELLRRLRERHDLDGANDAHETRIAALVRAPTLQLLKGGTQRAAGSAFLPVSSLMTILEDVETL